MLRGGVADLQVGPGAFPLPAWPMRHACSLGLNTDLGVKFTGNRSDVRYSVALDGLTVNVDWDTTTSSGSPGSKLGDLAKALASAVDVWYNVSGSLKCNDLTVAERPSKPDSSICGKSEESLTASWTGVCCNEALHMVNTMARGLGRDFFWPPNQPRNFNVTAAIEAEGQGNCRTGATDPQGYPAGSDPWSTLLDDVYGGLNIESASNIVFSNVRCPR